MQVGFWTGQILREVNSRTGPIILGQDSRTSGHMLCMALSAGLTAAGVEVWYLGLCPTPGVAYLTAHTEAIGGVMISASHNPPADNGIKIFGSAGTKLSRDLQNAIEQGLRGDRPHTSQQIWGQHQHHPHLRQLYRESLERSLGDLPNLQGLKVMLDLAWGAATELAPEAFRAMGAEVICLHDQPDGERINVNCGSTHLAHLQAAVLANRADVGFAFDGDADRVLAVDNQGRPIDGDCILFLWGKSLQQQGRLPGNTLVSTVMSNLGFERAWQAQGGTLIRTAVGDQYVQAEMEARGSMLGGEQSGHILCRHFALTGDGLLTALHIAALIQSQGLPLAALVDESFRPYPQKLQNVRVEDRQRRLHWQDCEPLQTAIQTAEQAMGDRGRVLVRASGTEPLIRVMVEAESAELVNHWTQTLVKVVQRHLT
jgi:phosphoglucosamine mutase